jgi:alpha-1,2-mannosyltransferase
VATIPTNRSSLLLVGGIAAVAAALGTYLGYAFTHPMPYWLDPVDLRVYRLGGFIAAHIEPWYRTGRASPLYNWPGYMGLKFTYTPFAALLFSILTLPARADLVRASVAVNMVALAAAVWVTLGGIGREGADQAARDVSPDAPEPKEMAAPKGGSALIARTGGALLLAAVLFWTEPVQRTIYLGQVELVLMALIMWDASQPDSRRWKGAGIGIAAGVKLVPLIFIPYLLVTRRFRAAAVAAGTFAVTVALGFLLLPRDSTSWWLGGVFVRGGRAGFVGWAGNQSLSALVTRLAGSAAGGHWLWLAMAGLTVLAGLAAAALIDRAGFPVAGVLTCALAALLASPISWDHHWVWVVPGVTALTGYALRRPCLPERARRTSRRAAAQGPRARRTVLIAAALAITAAFAAWPTALMGWRLDHSSFSLGLIWLPQNTNPGIYNRLGDRPWYPEYHWHGVELFSGNLYVLTGLLVFFGLIVFAAALARGPSRSHAQSTAMPIAATSRTAGVTTSRLSRASAERTRPAGSPGLPGISPIVAAVSLPSTSQSSRDAG